MTSLPGLTGKALIAALRKAGFEVVRIKGSHHFLRHADGRSTVVPVHAGDAATLKDNPGALSTLRMCTARVNLFSK